MYVLEVLVDMIRASYENGYRTFVDSKGVEWKLVPVLCLIATDMKEARSLKSLLESARQRMPCHLCTVLYEHCGDMISVDDIEYRCGERSKAEVKSALKAQK